MNCLSIVAALAVILCSVGVHGREKRQLQKVYGPCSHYAETHPGSFPEKPLPGQYVPQCSALDMFELIQTHPSTGYKWCVNPMTGEKLEGSDVKPGLLGGLFSHPKCGKCLSGLAKYWTTVSNWGIGGTPPQCDSKGKYANPQNSASGLSWCVDPETGVKIPGTEVGPSNNEPGVAKCDGRQKRQIGQTIFGPCYNYLQAHPVSTPPKPGQYVPQCNALDMFEVVQKHPSTGYQWCVDPMTGEKIEGSDVKPGFPKPKCGKCLYDSYTVNFNLHGYGLGAYLPKCDSKGLYKALQGGDGYATLCVNPETGAPIKGSEVAPEAGQAKC
jgi:hypothetical protein